MLHTLIVLFALSLSTLGISGTYDVPVPDELQGSARWRDISAQASQDKDNVLHVRYILPPDLVGIHDAVFEFNGKVEGSFAAVSGAGVYGNCMISEEKPLTCILKYPGLDTKINEAIRSDELKKKFTGSELTRRETVVGLFGADPGGLLMVELHRE